MEFVKKLQEIIKITLFYILTFILGVLVPKNKKIVVLVSSKGRFYNGNSKALFEYILDCDNSLEPYFYVSDKDLFKRISQKHRNIVYQYSLEGFFLFFKAKTICITHGRADLLGFAFSPLQNCLFLGHGIGTKALGYLKERQSFSERIELFLNKFFIYTIISDFDRYMFCSMNHLKPERIFVTGYPRTDCLYKKNVQRNKQKTKKILYAPTYYKGGITKLFPIQHFDFKTLVTSLEKHDLELGIRFHPNNYEDSRVQIQEFIKFSPRIIDRSPDRKAEVQDLLIETDILITDFSSISRDFLFLDRPMIFIMNGLDELGNLALPIRKEFAFCGYQVYNYKEFEQALEEILSGNDRYGEVRRFVRDLSYNYIDDKSSERVAELIKKLA
jgi:CDP-glycerol glycerophosphotransferase